MSLITWLLSLAVGQAGERAVVGAGRVLLGPPAEAALHKALANAAHVVADGTVSEASRRVGASAAIEELITAAVPARLLAGSALDDLEAAIRAVLEPLWTTSTDTGSSHAAELGIDVGLTELTSLVLDQVVASIGLVADATSGLGTLVALLQTQQSARRIAELSTSGALPRSTDGVQATHVNAWIAVEQDIPVVYVMNGSDAPIFHVRPTPALIGYRDDGEVSAEVGHSPLDVTHQIAPHSGFAWPMTHCPGWGGHGYVVGQVHVHFTDAAGTSWLLAHDQLRPEADPWSPGW